MDAAVSVSLGVIRSLPAKFERLLSPDPAHGLRLHKAEKNKICLLKNHLQELMDKFLLVDSMEVEAPASAFKCWVKEVRELSYDIDDFLDDFIHRLYSNSPTNKKNLHGKITRLREDLKRNQWVTSMTSRFRARLEEAVQRYKRYNLDKLQSRPILIDSDEVRMPLLYGEGARLVGTDRSMEKLLNWLSNHDGEQRLRVVSIVGIGGIGKTTLAKELYCKLRRRFDCRAFARSSQKHDMSWLLTSILIQVRRHQPPSNVELGNLTDTIRAYLQHKKYFIIIDDLWDASMWDIVQRALPDDKCYSRVLITTESDTVAQRCCGHSSRHILNMEPLSEKESNELFFSRFVGNQSENCEEFNKVLSKIIRKCGGFPLAIVATASVLARQRDQIEHFNFISRSLSSNLRTNPTMEGMKQVLSICYDNLPDCLKACLLYLSIYKEGHIIQKDDLVKQWITEGFICVKREKHMEEVAQSYFDELVNGGMIQPVDIKYNGEVSSCTVHYMVVNLIRYRSIEDNFVTALDHCQTNTRLADKVRRISLHFGDVDDAESPTKLRLSQVRSLVFFGSFNSLPSIVELRFLRVLVLHLWADRENISLDLTTVSKFFRLRNLNIACNVTLNLQIQLQGLEYLETLKINSSLREVPQDIVLLPSLLHLSLPGDVNMPNYIGRMASLRTLGYFDLSSNSVDNVQSLGKLHNVQDLHLTCSAIPCDNLEENVECLASVLWKLTNLKSLNLSSRVVPADANTLEASASSNNIFFDGLNSVSTPPALLEKLEFSPEICIFSRLPRWIGDLGKLSVIRISVWKLWQSDIDILSRLNALSDLSLYVRTAPADRIVFHKEGFKFLNYFKFICCALCIAISEEAMPNVRRFKLGFTATTLLEQCNLLVDVGFQNLTNLEVLTANVGFAVSDEPVRKAVQSALEDTFSMCTSRPIINVQLVGSTFYGDKEMSTMAGMGKCQTLEKTDVDTKGKLAEEQYRIAEMGSEEDTSIQDDSSRITLSSESSSYTRNTGISASRRTRRSAATGKLSILSTTTFMPSTAVTGVGIDDDYTEGQILESPNLRIYTIAELKNATMNFRPERVLGEGRFGRVYKGWVDEKTLNPSKPGTRMVVAIKKLNPEGVQRMEQWQSGISFLGRISHPNLVKLLGYCMDGNELLLVYEFMAKGSLEHHLFRRSWGVHEPLPWNLRLKILIGAARGLAFLHSSERPVTYREFKACNILLDSNFNAKLSDFGLAEYGPEGAESQVTRKNMETYGYAAQEYVVSTGHPYAKNDVFFFGVVLLETISGLRALDPGRPSEMQNLVTWAKPLLAARRKVSRLMDSKLEGQYSLKGAIHAAQLILKCLNSEPKNRPSMKEVAEALKVIESI